jgi:glutaconate CoA-transferase subunit A
VSGSKLYSLSNAISKWIQHGTSIVCCTALETCIPFAAGYEIIRQKKKELTLIGPISDILFDQLVGAECVKRIQAAWVGNVITGLGYNYKKAVESRRICVEHHSNFTISLALKAAAMGVSFLPTRSTLGSDLSAFNTGLKTVTCPFTGDMMAAVGHISPDVAIIHVQRADAMGNAHLWGSLGITREACMASRDIILTAEEIVPSDVISSDPNRVIFPGFRVSAVCHTPWGGYPSPVPGYYNRDHDYFLEYQQNSKTPEIFQEWMNRHVMDVLDRDDFMKQIVGHGKMENLAIKNSSFTEPVNYGY